METDLRKALLMIDELRYQIWDLRNHLAAISMVDDAPLMADMAKRALERNPEKGVQRPRQHDLEGLIRCLDRSGDAEPPAPLRTV
jgi:hypothetical protein